MSYPIRSFAPLAQASSAPAAPAPAPGASFEARMAAQSALDLDAEGGQSTAEASADDWSNIVAGLNAGLTRSA